MDEQEWLSAKTTEELLRLSPGRVSGRRLRLFACQCARSTHGFNDAICHRAIEVAEQIAEGTAEPAEQLTVFDQVQVLCDTVANADWYVAHAARAVLDPNAHQAAAQAHEHLAGFEAEAGGGTTWYCIHWARDIFGNPFRPVDFAPWRTDTAVALARQMYKAREFSVMPILADALQDAGCDNEEALSHCRGAGPHVRGCWVVDGVLGLE
jgi:hypothetical protein